MTAARVYIVGEIGQNHNGSMDIARRLIDMMAAPPVDHLFEASLRPMDAIKLTKRDLAEELSDSAMKKPYDSPHAFGKTYGEHRAALELDESQHHELYTYAKGKGLDVVETLCARGCLRLLDHFTPDRLKVASRDLTNLPLLEALAETRIPVILSTGMGGTDELDAALEVITRHHDDITILHCLSQYPAQYKNINLATIPFLIRRYPQYTIGYSDHSIGIMVPAAAVAMGARVIEKHITLDRKMKGSDHAGSLGPDGIYRMVRDIRNLEMALGEEAMFASGAVTDFRVKLERSVASNKAIPAGSVVGEADVHLLSPGDGVRWIDRARVVGKRAAVDIPANEIIYPDMVKE